MYDDNIVEIIMTTGMWKNNYNYLQELIVKEISSSA